MRLVRVAGRRGWSVLRRAGRRSESTWSGRGRLLERSSSLFVVVRSPPSTKGFQGGNACGLQFFRSRPRWVSCSARPLPALPKMARRTARPDRGCRTRTRAPFQVSRERPDMRQANKCRRRAASRESPEPPDTRPVTRTQPVGKGPEAAPPLRPAPRVADAFVGQTRVSAAARGRCNQGQAKRSSTLARKLLPSPARPPRGFSCRRSERAMQASWPQRAAPPIPLQRA
jgi:hypothetical protein